MCSEDPEFPVEQLNCFIEDAGSPIFTSDCENLPTTMQEQQKLFGFDKKNRYTLKLTDFAAGAGAFDFPDD